MDFLRRVLGRSTDSSTTSSRDDTISITQGDVEPTSPPEPVIEVPAEMDDLPKEQESAPNNTSLNSAYEKAGATKKPEVAIVGTRPLPPLETVIPKPGQRITFGQFSDVGMVRGNNQDAMLSVVASGSSSDDMADFGLFIVADGMGGHHDGEKASAIASRMVASYVTNEIFIAMLSHEMDDPDRPTITDILRDAVQSANDAVTKQIPEGGTTVTTAVVLGDLAYIAHVGDSRAYLLTAEGIEQVTRDHSLVQRLIELDQLTPEEAAEHPQRNVLYRAIGQSDVLDVDAITRRLPPRSRLLLCSDGLWNLVSEATIYDIVYAHDNPQDACGELVNLANDRGGPDNITVILIQVPN